MFFSSAQIACNYFPLPPTLLHPCIGSQRQISPLTRFLSKSGAFKCRWNNAALAANGRPRGHNYSAWKGEAGFSAAPWQVKSNVIAQWKRNACASRVGLCWQHPGLAFGSPAGRNKDKGVTCQYITLTGRQNALLLSLILLKPPPPQTKPHPSIHLRPSTSHSLHSSLSACLPIFCSSLWICVSTRRKSPWGAGFKHRNQKHMAHFQLPRSITAIYPEIAAKFPKVSSRFTTDCNVCLSHFRIRPLPLHSLWLFSVKHFKGLRVWIFSFFNVLSLVIMVPSFFFLFFFLCQVQMPIATQI